MEEKLKKIEILENRIKALEAREPVLSNQDIKEHIKRLKARKAKLEQE